MSRRTCQSIVTLVFASLVSTVCVAAASAQRRGTPPPSRPPQHRTFVFVGGFFYDAQFGPYPWWPRWRYPYPYYPVYDRSADVRVLVTPKEAAVYVDGFYAGIVDDFNGFFQRLTLPPGGHEIVLYLETYRTVRHRIYLSPGTTFRIELLMEKLPPGRVSETPVVAPPPPMPPPGSYIPPRTPPRRSIPPQGIPMPALTCTLSLNVQPPNADVLIDGERWMSSDGQRFVIQLMPGEHSLQVDRPGFQSFTRQIALQDGETLSLNVSLLKRRP